MSFIGIICENRNENYINQILSQKIKNKTVIFFKEDSIENLKNIKFETVIIMSNNEKLFSKKEILKNIISKAKYLIINADEPINLNFLQDMNIKLVTYGFNGKSTITASSVKEDSIMLCVQRNIKDLKGKEIEVQEINISKRNSNIPTSIIMGIATVLLLYGVQELEV